MKMTLNINSNVDANLARQDNINNSSFNRREGENPTSTNFLNNASFNNHNNTLNSDRINPSKNHNNSSAVDEYALTTYPNNVCLSHDCTLDGNHNNVSIDCITRSSVNSNTSIYAERYISISKLAYKYVLLSNVFISSFLRDVHSVYFDEEK